MLSVATKKILAELHLNIGSCEKNLELIRLSISKFPKFHVDHAFAKFASYHKLATRETIFDFLKAIGVSCEMHEVDRIISWYRSIHADALEVEDFIEILLPRNNQKAREDIERGLLTEVVKTSPLEYEVEYLLSRLFESKFA